MILYRFRAKFVAGVIFLFALITSAYAQKFNITTINCRLSADDRAYLEKIGKFEAKFYNVVFDTQRNDTLPVSINIYGKLKEYNMVQKEAMNTTFIDGFYSPADNRVFVYKSDTYMNTLLHETSHNLLNNNYQRSPQWFNEGIATLFGSLVIQDGEVYYAKDKYHVKLLKDLMLDHAFSLTSFFNYNTSDFFNEEKRPYVYAVSYCLIYFLVKDDMNNLQQIALLLRDGYSTNAAITKVFGSFDKFDKRFKDFYKPEVDYRR